jgi:uncharacterized cupin superfamily protein
MTSLPPPVAIDAADVPVRTAVSFYPEPFASRMAGRQKRQLGEFFGLQNFGINLTRLAPDAFSSLRHSHAKQDEFIYIVSGHPTLHTDRGPTQLSPGMCAGFRAGNGDAHHLHNGTTEDVFYLEIGDRTPGEQVTYPDDDLQFDRVAGQARFVHKDGTPY